MENSPPTWNSKNKSLEGNEMINYTWSVQLTVVWPSHEALTLEHQPKHVTTIMCENHLTLVF